MNRIEMNLPNKVLHVSCLRMLCLDGGYGCGLPQGGCLRRALALLHRVVGGSGSRITGLGRIERA